LDHFERLGISAVPVRTPDQLGELAGLVIPGGESTCLSRLMRLFGFDEAIRRAFAGGLKLWGTCAGAILLATRVRGERTHLGLIDIEIQRNAFGSQLDSFTATAHVPAVAAVPVPLTFIRAPKVLEAGPEVDVLLRMDDYIAAAESNGVLVTVFHPELTPCLAFHRYFLRKCGLDSTVHGLKAVEVDPDWRLTSWTRQTRLAPTGPVAPSPR
ncbi:MAG: pyridoxal 5'-phosphate synthase glutaminase subunit PdxT, partial [Kiritimatiellaeota bacterium]|nr:pyridoxal 5'-phosphate synthase glutaminase subunit PdxT [Kiritimatiellota bacterium]